MADHPVARVAGEIGGSFVAPVGSLGTTVSVGRGARALETGLKGAAIGGIAGFGGTSGDLDQRMHGAAAGAIGGGLVGGALSGVLPRAAGRASNEVVEAAENIGAPLARGLASDSKIVQMGTQAMRQFPVGGAKIEKAYNQAVEGVRGATERAADMLGGVGDKAGAGAAVRESIGGAVGAMESRADAAFSTLRRAIDADAPVQIPSSILAPLEKIAASRLAAGHDEGSLLQGLERAAGLLTREEGVSFNGLQRARSEIGKQISWDARNGGFMQGDLKQVYGMLTDAMDYAAQRAA